MQGWQLIHLKGSRLADRQRFDVVEPTLASNILLRGYPQKETANGVLGRDFPR